MNRSLSGNETGLVAYYPFNDAAGSPTTDDASLNNNVGTLYNGAAIVANSTAPICYEVPSNMVSWWKAENNGNDSIGVSHGTMMNGATFAAGKVGQAFSFDGVNRNYVGIPHNAALDITGAITMEAWVKPNAGTDGIIMLKGDPACIVGIYSYGMGLEHDGRVFVMLYSSSVVERYDTSAGIVVPGSWHHIAATWDGTANPNNVSLYVNGKLVQRWTKTTGLNSNTGNLIFGAHNHGFSRSMNGLVDEVQVYNRALTASEIAAIYNVGSGGKCFTPKTTPDAFAFTDQTAVNLDTVITSNVITVSGINSAVNISISSCTGTNCEYQINAGSWTSSAGSVLNGNTVRVRQTSSGSYSTQTNLTLNIGGVTGTFSVTTTAIKGDIDGDGKVSLADAVIALQTISGKAVQVRSDYSVSGADVNGDGRVGLAEVIYIMQRLAEARP